jgi:hypothetical protein
VSAALISLADHRARRLVDRLVAIQTRIDQSARVLLAGRPAEVRLEVLLDDMDRVLADLGRTARHVQAEPLREAITRTCQAHGRWSRARLGSDEERAAAAVYLDAVDHLARVAR